MTEINLNISDAEWEIMRIVWANQTITGRQIIDAMMAISDWKEGTIKSLINRLVNKEMIEPVVGTKPYQYVATLSELDANLLKGQAVLENICNKEVGNFMAQFLESSPLAKGDIDRMIEILQSRRDSAPDQVACNCPVGQCHCHLHGR